MIPDINQYCYFPKNSLKLNSNYQKSPIFYSWRFEVVKKTYGMMIVLLIIGSLTYGGENVLGAKETVVMDSQLVGFATLNGGTTGGTGYPKVITVSDANQLQKAIGSNRTIYIDGTITPTDFLREIKISYVSNLSIIGVADRGELNGIGLRVMNSRNIVIRNLTIHHVVHQFDNPNKPNQRELTSGDAIGIVDSSRIWVDHCTLYNAGVDDAAQKAFVADMISKGYTAAQAEEWEGSPKNLYDGLFDVTGNSKYITFSWNVVADSWKTCLIGSNDSDLTDRRITFHHNWFRNCNSRLPMVRAGVTHIYNNYYSDIVGSGINSRIGARVLVENNYFENVKTPISSSDGKGTWLAAGNVFVGRPGSNGGTANVTVPYPYTLETAEEAKVSVMAGAGAGKMQI